jgi:similar to stage IV sporulation protein
MLMKVRNYLRGSLQVELRGTAIERFLNLCAIHGVAFWDVRCLDVDHFTAWVAVDGYVRLRPYARKTGCRVRVILRRGLPFAARKASKRWALWLAIPLCVCAVAIMSCFVWTIEVKGCQQTTEAEILQLVAQAGLKTGTRRANCNLIEMKNIVLSLHAVSPLPWRQIAS